MEEPPAAPPMEEPAEGDGLPPSGSALPEGEVAGDAGASSGLAPCVGATFGTTGGLVGVGAVAGAGAVAFMSGMAGALSAGAASIAGEVAAEDGALSIGAAVVVSTAAGAAAAPWCLVDFVVFTAFLAVFLCVVPVWWRCL